MACFEAGMAGAISDGQLSAMALELSKLLTLYVDSEAGVHALTADELQGAVFADGARVMTFPDARPPIRELAVASHALLAVLRVLKSTARS